MKAFFQDLFEYNQYANQRFIQSFFEDGFGDESGIRLFSHMVNAHHVWNARLLGKPPMFEIWEIHVMNSFLEVDKENHRRTFQLLEQTEDFDKSISYTNSKGTAFENSVSQILMHLVNHTTYHRGQLARMIREQGIDPPNSDYIFYKRAPLS